MTTTPTVVQTVFAESSSAGGDITVTLTVTAGNVLHVWAAVDDANAPTPSSCSDNSGVNTYTLLDEVHETLHGNYVSQFRSNFGVAGGSTIVAVTFPNAPNDFRAICVQEINGALTVSDHKGNVQDTPGTGTDGVTTGTMSQVGPGLVTALSYHSTGAVNIPAAGTGFLSQGTGWTFGGGNTGARVEAVQFAGNKAATFTAGTDATHVTLGAIYQGSTAPPVLLQTTGNVILNNVTGAQTAHATSAFGTGHCVIFSAVSYDTPISSITLGGVSATRAVIQTSGTNSTEVWYAVMSGSPTDAIVVTPGGGGNYISYSVEEWSGLTASPLDQTTNNAAGTSASPSVTTPTLSQANELIYGVVFSQTSGVGPDVITNPSSPWSASFNESDGSSHQPGAGAYRTVSATTAVTATWTLNQSQAWIAVAATFKVADPAIDVSVYTLQFRESFLD